MLRVMLDLETLSTAANAAILSIGACANDGRPDFCRNVDLATCMQAGLKVDASTIQWWMQQSDEARAAFQPPAGREGWSLREALESFAAWLRAPVDGETVRGQVECELWAFPAQFDVTILGEAYKALGMKEPWHYRAPRCLRTAAALFPGVERVLPNKERGHGGAAHTALADAKAQMEWLEKIDTTLAAMRDGLRLAMEAADEINAIESANTSA